MRITDFESGRSLNDVCLTLTRDEAEELRDYLVRLTGERQEVRQVFLTELKDASLARELVVSIAA